MQRVVEILKQRPGIINAYGANCTIRPLERGRQVAAVFHGEYFHSSPFEVMTPDGPRVITVKWGAWENSLEVSVIGFHEIESP